MNNKNDNSLKVQITNAIGKWPSEYEHKKSTPEYVAEKILGHMSRMIGGSKSIYRYDNPKNLVVFNANVCTKENGKIWYGDVDVTLDHNDLITLSKELGTKLYILSEMDGRFENDKNPLLDNAIAVYDNGLAKLTKSNFHYLDDEGVPHTLTTEEYRKTHPEPPREPVKYDIANYEETELPNLKTFKIKKNHSVLEDFQNFFVDKHGMSKAKKLYPDLYVTKKYYEQLKNLVKKSVKKTFTGLHPVKIEQSVDWEMFDLAPNSFVDTPKWAKNDVGYIEKSKK